MQIYGVFLNFRNVKNVLQWSLAIHVIPKFRPFLSISYGFWVLNITRDRQVYFAFIMLFKTTHSRSNLALYSQILIFFKFLNFLNFGNVEKCFTVNITANRVQVFNFAYSHSYRVKSSLCFALSLTVSKIMTNLHFNQFTISGKFILANQKPANRKFRNS